MNHASTHNRFIAIVLLILYLLLPAEKPVYASIPAASDAAVCESAAPPPCESCPCSGNAESGCCQVDFCACPCHAALVRSIRATYAPLVFLRRIHEPFRPLPLVYRTIFVPPQNNA